MTKREEKVHVLVILIGYTFAPDAQIIILQRNGGPIMNLTVIVQ